MPDAAVIASRLYLPPAAACRYAPYPARFVAANSAFSVFRFAKRRKPLCCRSSSPKVLRLSGSPLNHRRRFAGYAHQGEAPSNAVQNEFPTMPSKHSWGRSTGQRLPPRSEAISHDRSHRQATYQGGSATVGNAAHGVPSKTAQGVCHTLHDPPLSCGYQKFLRHSAL